tara:strand:- start:2657 stop:4123 length:1467 start_codon:yes stop_codon:yes gene_type:complete
MVTVEEFNALKDRGFNVIPVVKEISLTNASPLSIFNTFLKTKNSFLLESIEGGNKWAQYSIIGLDCHDYFKVSGNEITSFENNQHTSFHSDSPLDFIKEKIEKYNCAKFDELPRFFGGYVGFFAYESAKYAEKRIGSLQEKPSKFDKNMPDIFLVRAEKLVVFDNFNNKIKIILNTFLDTGSYNQSIKEIANIEDELKKVNNFEPKDFSFKPTDEAFDSNFSKADFLKAVSVAKDYIVDGDVMQAVLAQDFSKEFNHKPFDLYQALRFLNPSPYMYFLNFEICQVVGASPEILVRLQGDQITLRPIAGTRRRGANKIEDDENAKDLLADPKELAEHLMLIDLGRNDVGKISKTGTVKVTEKMVIEKYSHVMHIVSNVEGSKKEDLSFIEVLKSTLPAGTLSGAPKIRAMEIINELEPSSRGIYGGAIGHISWDGDIDTAIAIRTAVIRNNKIHVGAGAGIVADSVPENEWHECLQKAHVFLDAIEMIK